MILESQKKKSSFAYAFEGIFDTIKTQKNIKVDLVFMVLVIIAGIVCKISVMEWIVCIFLMGAVIAAEIMNTAVEHTVDLVTREKHELAKRAKDAAAGAVLVVAITSAIIGLIIFVPKAFIIIENFIK